MSNRTSEANKAIALAWAKERQLVREGKGTRDWTPEQQLNILERGKAYGDDGKAFEGHHMKSAEKFPEYQGTPENIQFLSRPEHFAAHDGNFQNSTNGFYNPYTGKTIDFGSNKYEPCAIIELREPVIHSESRAQNTTENSDATPNTGTSEETAKVPTPTRLKIPERSGLGRTIKHLAGKVARFYVRHKNIIDTVVATTATVVIKESLGGGSKSSTNSYEDDDDYDYSTYPSLEVPSEEHSTASVQQERIIDRSSPKEHTVSVHRQRYNGEWRDKAPYPRGKNSDGTRTT